jgi:hypothetical protein
MQTTETAKIRIAHSLGTWEVYSHDDMATVPEGAVTYDGLMSKGWKNEGHARAYLKRLAKTQPDRYSEWHIIFDATVNRYFIYIRSLEGVRSWTCPNGDHGCNLRGYCVNPNCDQRGRK